jgi:2-oxoglutarate ferredoxin oxidoreductase subunit alpha
MSEKLFIMGNEALGRAARAAGAKALYGYPITPTSEVLHFWSKEACSEQGKKDGLVFLQAEDEIGASFMLIGGVMAGARCFTATGGPGHVLMQDAFSMAEAMRLPVVAYLNQRGGPSTSTVIYSASSSLPPPSRRCTTSASRSSTSPGSTASRPSCSVTATSPR